MGLDRFAIFILLVNVALFVFAVWTIVDSNAALDECRRRAEGAAGVLGAEGARSLCDGIAGIGAEIRFTLVLFQWALIDVILLTVWRITVGRRVLR